MNRTMVYSMLGVGLSAVSIPFLAHGWGAQRATATAMTAMVVNATPFQDNNGQVPPKGVYAGPLFHLSHDWPTAPLPPITGFPWQQAIHLQQITRDNAPAYTAALKTYVTANARQLIFNYENWDAKAAGWYNQPWLGSKREAIHGAYAAGVFGPASFPGTGLRATFGTHDVSYYDTRAAYTVFKIWGTTALTPDVQLANAQYAEGSVIVKAAMFASETPGVQENWWDALKGAAVLPLYVDSGSQGTADIAANPTKMPGYLAQFDIIVKDSLSSPKTGWVFATLVYDVNAPGDAWDKMVPLGAMWGNDPDVGAGHTLTETWINPQAPKYSTLTLGWGGRLSGPNDGAQNAIAYGGHSYGNVANSSCMGCHGTAEWDKTKQQMDSYILPTASNPPPRSLPTCGDTGQLDPNGNYICSPAPGSVEWMRWFQSRPGTVPQDAAAVALDYDEVTAFKSLPLWWVATGPKDQPVPEMLLPSHVQRYNQYTGAPLRATPK
jgi:hypothetical protein